VLARYLVAMLMDAPWAAAYRAVDGVVPVPLYAQRQQERGYNQAELLADAFCKQAQLPLRASWLTRIRATHTQVGLSATARRANVQAAFQAEPTVQGKRLIVLDDVYTTGATLRACAQALLAAGATQVYGLALACPPLPNNA
jgi:ComF family protein